MNLSSFFRFSATLYVLLAASVFSATIDIAENSSKIIVSEQSLRDARSQFTTQIVTKSLDENDAPLVPPKEVLSLVYYPTPIGKMAAYLTPDPKDGKRHPAVIWVHGGYGGISDSDYLWEPQPKSNDQSGSTFRQAGLVLMLPSFRGEDNNPGRYEMFYGELDDLESAYDWLAKQSWVDPERIYLAGHSTGGTRVLLMSEYSSKFRAYFSLGAVPDLKARVQVASMMVPVPFKENEEEYRLRSPAAFITSIKKPTWYFEGDEYYWSAFNAISSLAEKEHIPLQINKIENADHFNIIAPVTTMIAKKILKDTDEKCNISFSEDEIKQISKDVVHE